MKKGYFNKSTKKKCTKERTPSISRNKIISIWVGRKISVQNFVNYENLTKCMKNFAKFNCEFYFAIFRT
jgi:hypothetical protein